LFAEMLADAIEGRPRSEVMRSRDGAWAGKISEVARGSWRGRLRPDVWSSAYVVQSLEASLWSVGRTGDFRNAVLTAANLGYDADTTAAITGQLSGALYGVSGIPAEWRKRVAWGSRIESTAASLFDQSGA
jgi:ADP-ribosyl-[dinitrogen reductase] hydrolase